MFCPQIKKIITGPIMFVTSSFRRTPGVTNTHMFTPAPQHGGDRKYEELGGTSQTLLRTTNKDGEKQSDKTLQVPF